MCSATDRVRREYQNLSAVRRLLHCGGFSLVEVTLALGVAAFCLIAVLGLLPVGVQTNQRSISGTAGASILSNVIADIRAARALSTSLQFGLNIPSNSVTASGTQTRCFDENGTVAASCTDARYRLTITFVPNNPDPTRSGSRMATLAVLRVTWPAVVDPTTGNPSGSMETFAAFDRN